MTKPDAMIRAVLDVRKAAIGQAHSGSPLMSPMGNGNPGSKLPCIPWSITNPVAGVIPGVYLAIAKTAVQVNASVIGSGSVTFNIEKRSVMGTAGTAILSSDLVATAAGVYSMVFADANLDVDMHIVLVITNVTGAVDSLGVTLYTTGELTTGATVPGPAGPAGPDGPAGPAGVGIAWLGTFASPPGSPTINQAYRNSVDKKVYVWTGTAWDEMVEDGPIGPGGGHTIEDEGTPVTQRSNLNFVGSGVTVTDDAINDASVVTIPGGGGGGSGFYTLSDGAAIDWDLPSGSGRVTLGGNRTLNDPTGLVAGGHFFLSVVQDGTGNRLISSWGSIYKFPGNIKPILSTYLGREDILSFECDGTYMFFTGIAKDVTNVNPSLSYLTNQLTWLEANGQCYSDNGVTLCNDTDTIYVCKDQSANVLDAVQVIPGNRMQYRTNILSGLPVMRCDGLSTYMDIAGLNGGDVCTFFMVVIPGTTTPIGIFDSSSGPTPAIRNEPGGNWDWYAGAPATDMALADTSPVLMEFHHNQSGGRTVTYYKNGNLISTHTNADATPTDWTTPCIGAINHGYAYYLGDMAAFLVYGEDVSGGNSATVRAYLKAKYGIT